MSVSIVPEVFTRNLGSITAEQQQILQQATVSVIGCGGLGGFVIEELARLGIGSLQICDPDSFDATNINRQLHARRDTIGRNKAECAARRIREIHEFCTVHWFADPFQNAGEPLLKGTDVVIDCLDTPGDRLQLAATCSEREITLVHGAVDRWYGQVAVLPPRSSLLEELYRENNSAKKAPSVPACTVAVVASIQAAEACKLLLDIPSPLVGKWMSIDLKRLTFDLI